MSDTRFSESVIRRANPRPAGASGPEVEWSTAELLSHIEHRSETMETIERDTGTRPPVRPRRRGLLVAAAAAAVVVLIGAVVFAFASDRSDTDVVEPTPTTLTAPTTVPSPTTTPPVTTVPATTVPATTVPATAVAAPQVYDATWTWDGETCTFDGPTEARVGDALNLTHVNNSTVDSAPIVFYLTSGTTVADVTNYFDNELGNVLRLDVTPGWIWPEINFVEWLQPPLETGMVHVEESVGHRAGTTSTFIPTGQSADDTVVHLRQPREHIFVCIESVDGIGDRTNSDLIMSNAPQTIKVSR